MIDILQLINRILVSSYFSFFFGTIIITPSVQGLRNSTYQCQLRTAALATQIIAGFLVIFGFFTAYATLVLIAFTLGATFIYHRFWVLVPGLNEH